MGDEGLAMAHCQALLGLSMWLVIAAHACSTVQIPARAPDKSDVLVIARTMELGARFADWEVTTYPRNATTDSVGTGIGFVSVDGKLADGHPLGKLRVPSEGINHLGPLSPHPTLLQESTSTALLYPSRLSRRASTSNAQQTTAAVWLAPAMWLGFSSAEQKTSHTLWQFCRSALL